MHSIEWPEHKVELNLSELELTGFAIAGYANYGPNFQIRSVSGDERPLNIPNLISGYILLAPTGGPFPGDYNPNITWRSNLIGIFGGATDDIMARMDTYTYTLWLKLLTNVNILVIYNHSEIVTGIIIFLRNSNLNPAEYIRVIHENVVDRNYHV